MSDQERAHDDTERLIQAFLGDEEQPLPADHRSGYVAVVGKPNVGKSTLVNALIGHKVAITSPKPQTTRRRILGILTREDAQVLFLDTPGVHEPKQALNRYMMREVDAALKGCDAILFVTDVSRLPTDEDHRVAERIAQLPQPKLLAMNKADLLDPCDVVEHVAAHEALLPQLGTDAAAEAAGQAQARSAASIFDVQTSILTSGTRGDNLDKLLHMILKTLPYGPRYFPAGQFTDQNQRFLAAEFVREQALRFLEQEVPHGIAVAIEEVATAPERRDLHRGNGLRRARIAKRHLDRQRGRDAKEDRRKRAQGDRTRAGHEGLSGIVGEGASGLATRRRLGRTPDGRRGIVHAKTPVMMTSPHCTVEGGTLEGGMRTACMQNPFMTVDALPDKGAGIFAASHHMSFMWGPLAYGAPFLSAQLRAAELIRAYDSAFCRAVPGATTQWPFAQGKDGPFAASRCVSSSHAHPCGYNARGGFLHVVALPTSA
ncbi:MAG: hypothetical protein KatS3mg052_2220 [Candidatus Roseilinea sp.]|nr:MAG: hypothetical protein KatS3mg052_2220 [Candidatus Roseilinea sp.]